MRLNSVDCWDGCWCGRKKFFRVVVVKVVVERMISV